ncbi:MAG: xylanase [Pirellulaceae bacterium]|nr:MAG: xylanase [Pirellulaceae bacterium]
MDLSFPLNEGLLSLYRTVTLPGRELLRWRWRRSQRFPLAILFYHRVADRHANPWTISTADFARHLDWLETHFDIVSLEEVQQRIRRGICPRPTVAITFDDGYAENCDFALPELIRRQIPATYFVATDFVAHGRPFPHDVAAGQPLPPNTIEQLRELSDSGITIGAHTRSHCDLGKVGDGKRLDREIVGSKEDLEQWIGRAVQYFAFPYGRPANVSQAAIDRIRSAGYAGFCSAFGAWNWLDADPFHLRRIHGDPGLERLKNWLTFDPRKLWQAEPDCGNRSRLLAGVAS